MKLINWWINAIFALLITLFNIFINYILNWKTTVIECYIICFSCWILLNQLGDAKK